MQVAVWYSNSDLRIEDRPRPDPGRGELLLRVEASGICGSDLMEWYRKPKAPVVLGHEVAGTVEAVGAGVTDFAEGSRVVATHHVPCEECRYCRSDRHSVCETLRRTTFDPGGFAEYVRLTEVHVARGVFELPAHLDADRATFVEPLACAIRAQRLAGVREGDRVAVLGAGISGILQLQLARLRNAHRVIVTDVDEAKLAHAERLGADAVFGATDNIPGPYEHVIVCTAAPAAFDQALRLVDLGGTVTLFAPLPRGTRWSVDQTDLWLRNVTLRHSYAGPPAEMAQALELIASDEIDVGSMITHRLPLSRIQEGFDLMRAGGDCLKVLVKPEASCQNEGSQARR